MELGTVFKISLYSLTALVGAILGSAETEGITYGSNQFRMALPYLSIPITVMGYLYTERRKRGNSTASGLSSAFANMLGMIALGATIYEFTRDHNEAKLLAGTHLLLYATWIVIFQKKTIRLYWFLMALGILQLAVASVLTTKGWFGFCALSYMFGAVWTLSIFSLWRAEQEFEEKEHQRFVDVTGQLQPVPTSPNVRWLQSEVRSSVQHEDGSRWLTGRFVTGVLLTSCSALLVSAAFFAFVPRVWVGTTVSMSTDPESMAGLGRKTGLAKSVHLGSLGPVLESMERVFEIQLRNQSTKKIISAQEYADRLGLAEPLFRASVMTHYENGHWATDTQNHLLSHPFQPQFRRLEIEQTIRLDSSDSGVLFCMGQPFIMVDSEFHPLGEMNDITGVASLTDHQKESGVLSYRAYSRLPAEQPMHYEQTVSKVIRDQYQRLHYFDKTMYVSGRLKRLKELTREILDKEKAFRQKAEGTTGERKLTRMEIATALESHLRDSGIYSYSLDLSIQDPKIDPIEDFLFNRKEGHCEYFATALTLMLRSARIPARLVSGYKGGVVRSDKPDWMEVQQRFAHVWVEAWITDQGWTTFDGTPADGRSQSVMAVAERKPSLWNGVQSTLAGLWSDNILNMSLARQEESIYRPLREAAFAAMNFAKKLWTSPAAAFAALFKVLSNRENWFSVRGGLVAFILLSLISLTVWTCRWAIRRIRLWLANRGSSREHSRRRLIEFYERFVGLMQSHGLIRAPTQTQQEFADMVASAYTPELAAIGLVDVPHRISNLFYQVRFGEQDLSDEEARRMEELITRMEQVLSKDKR